MNKKWIVLPLMLVCLTSCKAQPASSESSAPPVNQTSASASLSENAAASTVSEKQLDQVIKQVCKELNDPGSQRLAIPNSSFRELLERSYAA